MTKRQIMLTITLMLGSALSMAAQQPAQPGAQTVANPCERFKMRIITPDEKLDAKAVIQPPNTGIEYKGIVINPCGQADAKAGTTAPRVTGTPKPLPLLKLNPEAEQKLLTPAEMLKQLTQPAAPKPKS